ncbi:MAG TPA: ketosteroid isomerase [Gammaproteobacteria bacterium]|nr:ketosteroid isomerase [Gammaproteobacteria bacterium]
MKLTKQFVADFFNNLEIGQQDKFFSQVSPNVLWQVMGTHPLAGIYRTKQEFIEHTFTRLHKMLNGGPILKVNNIFIVEEEPVAIVEMLQLSSSIYGNPFNNTYCWIVKFQDSMIIEVRAYLDSALVQQLISETGG